MISPLAYLWAAMGKAQAAYREGRLEPSPRQWLLHLRNLRREMSERPIPSSPEPMGSGSKADVTRESECALDSFLASGARLALPAVPQPDVSIILVLYNRAELTLRCLRSIADHAGTSIEVVVVDNGSEDLTHALLSRLDGLRVLRNLTNEGFVSGVNRGAAAARGRLLLLLNNDAELLPGTLSAATEAFGDPTVGAVGGPIVALDGSLQEAGSIIWRDGSCLGYGRGQSLLSPEYQFVRDVDYCSAAFLLTRRDRFMALGGFDESYRPAYYEDADYCARLWQAGLRVVYEPHAVVRHFEFASSSSREQAIRLQSEHWRIFVARHAGWLGDQAPPGAILAARARRGRGLRVLYLDDRVPHCDLGAGFPRALAMVRTLVEAGHFVTLLPLSRPEESCADAYRSLPRTVEVAQSVGAVGLERFLRERDGYYDRVLVSRPHNMQRLRAACERFSFNTPIVYDAEAVYANREITRRGLGPSEARLLVEEETALSRQAHVVIAVSDAERAHFVRAGHPRTVTLGHTIVAAPTLRGFPQRRGMLFVGALYDETSPNVEGLSWFARAILPLLPDDIEVTAVGRGRLRAVEALAGPRLQLVGPADELTSYYDCARIFIAPTRWAAGIPCKVYDAAAHGLPVVATPVLADQLGWHDGRELLVADGAEAFAQACHRLYTDADLWARLRGAALERITTDCAPARFRQALSAALA